MQAATNANPAVLNSRAGVAATCLVAGGLLQAILGLVLAPHQNPGSPYFALICGLNALSHALLAVGVAVLLRSRAAGSSLPARGGLLTTLFGLALLIVAEFVSLVNMDVAIMFFSAATLAILAGMTSVGIAVLRSGHWTGWRRFTPLLCGLFVLLVVIPSFGLPGYAANYAIGAWGFCWLLLGLALREEPPGAA
jgi:hypothetical protein